MVSNKILCKMLIFFSLISRFTCIEQNSFLPKCLKILYKILVGRYFRKMKSFVCTKKCKSSKKIINFFGNITFRREFIFLILIQNKCFDWSTYYIVSNELQIVLKTNNIQCILKCVNGKLISNKILCKMLMFFSLISRFTCIRKNLFQKFRLYKTKSMSTESLL